MSRATLSATPYSGTFRPTSIAGCQLWLDGADASQVTYSTGSNISQWKDKSGNANHGSQSTAGQQPYYSTASNAVVFSGAQVMTCPLSASSTIETCFFVFSTTINKGVLIGAVTSPGRNIDFYDSYNMRIVQQYNALVLSSTYTFSPNTTVLATTQTTSTNSYIFMYGSQTNSNSTVANYGTGITSVIGTNGSDPPVEPFNGPMFEMIIFNTVLTTAQRQQVEGYLAWKWGTQASLPGGHLYASAAPTSPNALGITRPALSAALAPTPVRALGKASYTGIFTPTSIAGCRLWLDAADATTFTISSGSNVSTWSDKSGSSSSLSNTTANPPYFTTYNGYPTVSFRGSLSSTSNVLSNQTFSIAPANISIFIITQALQNGGSFIHPGILTIFPNPLSGVDYRDGLTITGGNASSSRFDVYGGSGTITGIDYSGSGLTPRGVYSVVNTSNVLYGYANGTQWGTNTFTFNTTNVGIALGMRHLGTLRAEGGASAFDGNISEVIIYNTALNTTQRQQVEGYLAWKWGLQASLASGHPHLSATPIGASLRPAISQALVPAGVRSMVPIKKPIASLTLTNSGSTDSYIASYLSNGYVNSIARQGGTGADVGNGIATDTNGNIIITGHYSSNPFTLYTTAGSAFSTTLVNSGQTAFVAQYSSSGAVNWVARFSGSSVGLFCKTDSSNNIYVFGYFTSAPLTAYSSSGTAFGTTISTLYYFLVKYNSSGTIQWIANIGGTGQTNQNSLTCDTNGNVIVTCTGGGITPLNSDGTSYTGSGILGAYRVNGFIVYYNTSGTIQWVASFAGGSRFWNQAISVDSSGNVYCSGYSLGGFAQIYNASGTGVITIAGASGQNGYIAKYTSTGTNVSGTAYGGSGVTAAPLSQVTDSNADTTIVGTFTGTTFIAYSNNSTSQPFSNTLSNPGTTCGFIVKYNSSFVVQWTANIQAATGVATPTGVTCDSLNNIYVSVYTTGNVTIYSSNGSAATTITNTGTNTSFIVKFSSAGLFIWAARQSGGASTSQYLYGIVTDSIGNPYAVGAYTSASGFVYSTGF